MKELLKDKKRIVYLVLTILIMGLIFYFSAQTEDVSTKQAIKTAEIIENVTSINTSENKIFNISLGSWAHVFLYTLLGISTLGLFKNYYQSILTCFIYSLSDEFHQLFVDGRSCTYIDLIKDMIGYMIPITICLLINGYLRKKKAL